MLATPPAAATASCRRPRRRPSQSPQVPIPAAGRRPLFLSLYPPLLTVPAVFHPTPLSANRPCGLPSAPAACRPPLLLAPPPPPPLQSSADPDSGRCPRFWPPLSLRARPQPLASASVAGHRTRFRQPPPAHRLGLIQCWRRRWRPPPASIRIPHCSAPPRPPAAARPSWHHPRHWRPPLLAATLAAGRLLSRMLLFALSFGAAACLRPREWTPPPPLAAAPAAGRHPPCRRGRPRRPRCRPVSPLCAAAPATGRRPRP